MVLVSLSLIPLPMRTSIRSLSPIITNLDAHLPEINTCACEIRVPEHKNILLNIPEKTPTNHRFSSYCALAFDPYANNKQISLFVKCIWVKYKNEITTITGTIQSWIATYDGYNSKCNQYHKIHFGVFKSDSTSRDEFQILFETVFSKFCIFIEKSNTSGLKALTSKNVLEYRYLMCSSRNYSFCQTLSVTICQKTMEWLSP